MQFGSCNGNLGVDFCCGEAYVTAGDVVYFPPGVMLIERATTSINHGHRVMSVYVSDVGGCSKDLNLMSTA